MQLINLSQRPEYGQQLKKQSFPSIDNSVTETNSNVSSSRTSDYSSLYQENKDLLVSSSKGKILFSIKETAHILGVSYEFVRQNILARTIPVVSFGERKMVHINELAKLITKGIVMNQ